MELRWTKHGKQRCKERGISPMRLYQQLLAIPFDPSISEPVRWDIPNTNVFVTYNDIVENNKDCRLIITVSMRYVNTAERVEIKEKKEVAYDNRNKTTLDYFSSTTGPKKPRKSKMKNWNFR